MGIFKKRYKQIDTGSVVEEIKQAVQPQEIQPVYPGHYPETAEPNNYDKIARKILELEQEIKSKQEVLDILKTLV